MLVNGRKNAYDPRQRHSPVGPPVSQATPQRHPTVAPHSCSSITLQKSSTNPKRSTKVITVSKCKSRSNLNSETGCRAWGCSPAPPHLSGSVITVTTPTSTTKPSTGDPVVNTGDRGGLGPLWTVRTSSNCWKKVHA